ncbi:MAG: hypothetical protein ABSA97_04385 [Verrucomicrobiia bacterium]
MKHLPIVLFFSGLLIQVAGFFGEHTAEIPFILRFVAPSYCHAHNAIRNLKENNRLRKDDDGFSQVSTLLISYIREIDPRPPLVNPVIDNVQIVGSWLEVGKASIYVHFTITSQDASSPTNRVITLDRLDGMVDDLKKPNILFLCFGVFAVGTVIEIGAFFLERKESHYPSNQAVDHNKQQSADTTKQANQKHPAA